MHVYLAPLKDGTLFKIGKSDNPKQRLTELSYWYDFDIDKIVIVKCPSAQSAFRLESMLHEVFEDSNKKDSSNLDGKTEFFNFSVYTAAIELCGSVCKTGKYSFVKFVADQKVKLVPSDLIIRTFARKIKSKRLELCLTQARLAKRALVSKRTIERLENNGRIAFLNVIKIISVLGLQDQLLGPALEPQSRQRVRTVLVGDSDHEPEKGWTRTLLT